MKRTVRLTLLSVLLLGLVACSAWPTIIATAEAIATLAGAVDPALSSFSVTAVTLLQTSESAGNAYNGNKSSSTEAAYVAAIQAIETELPADLKTLKVSSVVQTRVTAAVSIILDYVEGLAAQVPATAQIVSAKRAARALGPAKPLTRSQIKARWANEVCRGDPGCAAQVK